jgi:hypothetical protein
MRWFEDRPTISLNDPFTSLTMALYYTFIMARTGTSSPPSTLENVRKYTNRPILFISTGQGSEFSAVSAYFEAAGEPKFHWNIPDSSHCAAQITHPQAYEQHLVNFFNSSLLK